MSLITDFGVFLGNRVFKGVEHFSTIAVPTQEQTLLRILQRNKDCMLGKKYDFANIHSIREFQDKVPIGTFEDYAPLIDRMINEDEKDLITSSRIIRYTSSSGSVGKPKLQPKTARDLWNMQCMGFAATPACAARWFRTHENRKLPKQRGPLVLSLNGHPLKNGMQCNGAAQVPFSYIKPLLPFFSTTPLTAHFRFPRLRCRRCRSKADGLFAAREA